MKQKVLSICVLILAALFFISIDNSSVEVESAEIEEELSSTLNNLHAGPKNSNLDIYINGCIITWMIKYPSTGYKPTDKRVLSSTTSVDIRTLDTNEDKVSVIELTNNAAVKWRVIGANYFENLQVLRIDTSPNSSKEIHLLRNSANLIDYPNFVINAFVGTKTALIPINHNLRVFISKTKSSILVKQMASFRSTCED